MRLKITNSFHESVWRNLARCIDSSTRAFSNMHSVRLTWGLVMSMTVSPPAFPLSSYPGLVSGFWPKPYIYRFAYNARKSIDSKEMCFV